MRPRSSTIRRGPRRHGGSSRSPPTTCSSPTTRPGWAVGFVSGVETTHPDKGTEMFLYELGVDESARRQGVGRALVEALAAFAEERGCYGMWVLTEDDNVAARKTYERARRAARPI